MGSTIADDKVIVEEAKRKFGDLSDKVKHARHLREVTAALRSLALVYAMSDPNVCDKILRFQKKHKLAGI
jgi:hypothetical protein